MGGPALWAAGADYLTTDNKVGFDDPAVATSLGKLHDAVHQRLVAARRADRLVRPVRDQPGPDRHAVDRACGRFPRCSTRSSDDFGVLGLAEAVRQSVGAPSVPIGAYG